MPPAPAASRRAWTVVIVATLTMAVSYVDRSTLAFLAPTVTKELGLSDFQYGVIVSAFSLSYLVATPLSGWWIDGIGARRGLTRSVLAWSAVAAMHALVPGFTTLFAFRIALGFAEGPGFPGAAQTVHRMLPDGERDRGVGVLFTGSSIGGMLTPLLAGWLYGRYGWRAAFLGTAVAGLAWVPAWLAVTRHPAIRAQLDRPAPDAGAGAGAAKVRFPDLVASPVMQRALIGVFAMSPVVGFVNAWAAKHLMATYAIEQRNIGHFLWLPPIWFDLGALAFGDVASRTRRGLRPPRLLYAAAAVLAMSLGGLVIGNATPWLESPWGAVGVMAIALAGCGAISTLATSDMLRRLPAEAIALAGGTLACAQSLAFVISSPVIGYAHDRGASFPAIAAAVAAWVVPGSLVWLLWRPADRLEHKV